MSAQPDGLDPERTEFWAASQSWGGYRMYWSEKQARRFACGRTSWVDGKWTQVTPPKVYKVSLNWEEV